MAVDYARMAEVARKLIADNGREIIIRKLQTTASDPNKPWRGNTNPDVSGAGLDPVTLDAVAVPPSSASDLGFKIMSPDLILNASNIYIAAPPESEADLSEHTEVKDGDRVYRITKLDVLRPANTTLLYFIMVDG